MRWWPRRTASGRPAGCRSSPTPGAAPSADAQVAEQALFLDPPVAVLLAVEQDDRDAKAVLVLERGVGRDVHLGPRLARNGRDAVHHDLGVVTQVTTGPGQQRQPHDNSDFLTLPVAECGSAATNSTTVGHLNRARFCAHQSSS